MTQAVNLPDKIKMCYQTMEGISCGFQCFLNLQSNKFALKGSTGKLPTYNNPIITNCITTSIILTIIVIIEFSGYTLYIHNYTTLLLQKSTEFDLLLFVSITSYKI